MTRANRNIALGVHDDCRRIVSDTFRKADGRVVHRETDHGIVGVHHQVDPRPAGVSKFEVVRIFSEINPTLCQVLWPSGGSSTVKQVSPAQITIDCVKATGFDQVIKQVGIEKVLKKRRD